MNEPHIRERDLRLFLILDALLEQGSVTRAAESLGVTQSAVSHALRALRERLDDPLLVRVGNRMLATPRAESMKSTLRLGFAELGRVLTRDAEFAADASTRLFSLATHDDLIFTVVPDIVARIRRDAPGVDIRFDAIGPGLLDALTEGRVDAVLARGDVERVFKLDGPIVRVCVASDTWTCLMRPDHPAAAESLTLEAFLASPHVAIGATGAIDPVDAAVKRLGRQRRVAVTVPSFPAAGWFAAASDMIATLPERVAARAVRRLDLVTRAPPLCIPPSETYIWWHERYQRDAGHVWWRGLLADALKTAPRSQARSPTPTRP